MRALLAAAVCRPGEFYRLFSFQIEYLFGAPFRRSSILPTTDAPPSRPTFGITVVYPRLFKRPRTPADVR
jgi:hypothetical protein